MPDRREKVNSLTAEQQAQLEQIVAKFELAWFRGERPALETFLPSDPTCRKVALLELIHVDIEFRSKAGEVTQPQAYLSRFPELRADLQAVQSIIATVGKFESRKQAIKADAGVPGLKPELRLRESQRTKPPTESPALKSTKETGAISSSELSEDTDGGTAMESDAQAGIRLYATLKRGLTLGNYVILDKLGQGGMGTVFRAEHRRMLREVALKVLSPEVLKAPQAVQRFHREVRVAAKLTHPNIVTAYDADEEQGVHFLVMEIVEGTSLAALVKRHGPLPPKKAVDFVVQAARGLDYAHSKGIVHRDIKPGNLMLDQFGIVKILDLGLARLDEGGLAAAEGDLTDTGNVMGTIDYISPEQALNTKHADHRSDIYSLGCTLWFLLTGKAVYGGQTPVERILAHRDRPVPSLRAVRNDVSMELEAVFRTMVAKSPDERFKSMADVLKAFEECHLGGAEASSGGYTIVAPMADEIPLAERSFAIEQAIAPPAPPSPTPAPVFRGPAGTNPKSKPKSATGKNRRSPKSTSVFVKNQAAADSLAFGRKVMTAAAIGLGVVFLVVVIALVYWALNRTSPSKRPEAEPEPKLQRPAPAAAIFTADEAKGYQARWSEFLGQPVEKSNSIGMKLVLIPQGEFDMGTAPAEIEELLKTTTSQIVRARYQTESPVRRVKIDRPFYMSTQEVTQAEYEKLLQANPSWFSKIGEGSDRVQGSDTSGRPVERITWFDALTFCNRLSEKEGLHPCYKINDGNISFNDENGYRLPTEAEWEYACRAGTAGPFANSTTDAEQPATSFWHDANSGSLTQAAATNKPNAFGLFDMHGNVWEWCHNEYGAIPAAGEAGKPIAGSLQGAAERVIRGGSWMDDAIDCRSAVRSDRLPSFRDNTIGFRVLLGVMEGGG